MPKDHTYGTPVKPKIANDAHALAEFFWRKLRNHDPLRQRYGETQHPLQGRLEHEVGTNQTFYVAGGKKFRITVEEVSAGGEAKIDNDADPAIKIEDADDAPIKIAEGDD